MILATLIAPLIGALVLFALPRAERVARPVSMGFALLTLVLSLFLLGGGTEAISAPWIPSLGVSFSMSVDGLSVFLIVMTALVTLAVLGFAKETERPNAFYGLILLVEATTLGAFVSVDLLLFYVFWELMIIPAYLLIAGWGGAGRQRAAMKFLIYSLVPSIFMLVAILVLAFATSESLGVFTFSLSSMLKAHLTLPFQYWLFIAFSLAFMVKVPVWPFHSWMPDAYGESPPPVAALLSGVMSKTGLYALIRFAFPLFPEAARVLAPWLGAIAIVSILYGAVIALTHRDGRMVISYSSLSHLGLVFLAVVAMNPVGLDGAVLQMVNHGIYATALFLLFGLVEAQVGTRDISKLGGLARGAPLFAGVFLFAVMAALGLPGLNGFAGEFLLLVGIFKTNVVWAWIAILAVILAGAYFIRLFQKTTQGPDTPEGNPKVAMRPLHLALMAPFLALMLYLGLAPGTVVNRVHPVSTQIAHIVGSNNPVGTEVSGR